MDYIMASRMIHFSSNCNLANIQINCSHQWEIPDFGTWIKANKGKWLDGPTFSTVEPIQLLAMCGHLSRIVMQHLLLWQASLFHSAAGVFKTLVTVIVRLAW